MNEYSQSASGKGKKALTYLKNHFYIDWL